MPTRRRKTRCFTVASALSISLLFAGGCTAQAPTGVTPGSGPAATTDAPPASASVDCSASTTTQQEWIENCADDAIDGPVEGEPSEAPSAAQQVASFKDKYTFPDGVEVEVTRIKRGKVTQEDVDSYSEGNVGDPWVQLTVRVKNGSAERITDLSTTYNVTYGPDGDQAETAYIYSVDDADMSGSILPGKSKTGSDTFAIPAKYQDDVVLEFSFGYDHEAAIFSGSVED